MQNLLAGGKTPKLIITIKKEKQTIKGEKATEKAVIAARSMSSGLAISFL